MKIISNQLLPVVIMTFVFWIVGDGTKPVYSQSKMMEADIRSPVKKEVKKGANLPGLMPHEPLLFKLDKKSPPSAMLLDRENPEKYDTTQIIRKAKKTEPYPMPSEPR